MTHAVALYSCVREGERGGGDCVIGAGRGGDSIRMPCTYLIDDYKYKRSLGAGLWWTKVHMAWYMCYIAWYMGYIAWYMGYIAWYMGCMAWYMGCMALYMGCMAWYMGYMAWYIVCCIGKYVGFRGLYMQMVC